MSAATNGEAILQELLDHAKHGLGGLHHTQLMATNGLTYQQFSAAKFWLLRSGRYEATGDLVVPSVAPIYNTHSALYSVGAESLHTPIEDEREYQRWLAQHIYTRSESVVLHTGIARKAFPSWARTKRFRNIRHYAQNEMYEAEQLLAALGNGHH